MTTLAAALTAAAPAMAAGADAEAALVRCADVTYPTSLTGCGTDPLSRGQLEVKKNGDLDVQVADAAPNVAYDIVLHSLNGANQSTIAVLATDATGAGRLRSAAVFDLNQAGVVAFTLGRNGSVEFVAGFVNGRDNGNRRHDGQEFEAGLIACGAVNVPAVQTGCGTDTVRSGSVKIDDDELKIDLTGGPSLTTYDVVFRPLGGGTDVPLGTLTTNARGRGLLRLDGFVPDDAVGAGNVVLRRDQLDQFVSGFQSNRRRPPRVAKVHSGLVRCGEINTLSVLADCGIDQLDKGEAMIDEKGDVKVHLFGAVPQSVYEVFFVSFDASSEVSLGTLTTNPAGNGHLFARDAFPIGARGTGNVVVKRDGVDQYVTGFIVVR